LRAMWKGSLGFGLVNIPVRLFAATESGEVKFRYLHLPCHTPLQYQKMCPTCNVPASWEEIVRGFEYEKGHFVVLSEEEINSAAGPKEKFIEIKDFIDIDEIDPVYFQNSYYLAPDGPGSRPYVLLRRAMLESGKIALATITLRTKESLAAVRVYENVLSLSTMFYPDEVRAAAGVPGIPGDLQVQPRELEMAVELVKTLQAPFEPQKYSDHYRQKIMELIDAKKEGREVFVAPSPDREKVVDLLEALQASVEKARTGGEEKGGREKAKSRAAPARKKTRAE